MVARLHPFHPVAALAIALLTVAPAARGETQVAAIELAPIEVVATTPVGGLDLPLRLTPANAQVLRLDSKDKLPASDLASMLQSGLGGVGLAPAQGNPYQNDLYFRGFVASPLLGLPQGLSVYLDGVRINEGFGDTLNWDLIPPNAIARVNLVPGSPPAFGLNTLGGALGIETRDGRASDGLAASLQAGSFGRANVRLRYGAHHQTHDLFVAWNQVDEAGWRKHTTTAIQQAFGKFGRREAERELEVSVLGASNRLDGGQTLPREMLDQAREAYTWPDQNRNRLAALSTRATWRRNENQRWDLVTYLRQLHSRNQSSNVNHDFDEDELPAEPQGSLDRSTLRSLGYGASLQWGGKARWGERSNRLLIGASGDWGRSSYRQLSQAGDFTADRGLALGDAEELEVSAQTAHHYYGLYFENTLSLDRHWHVQAAARWNAARISLRDRSGEVPALDGDHRFRRVNPAVGLVYRASDRLGLHLGYSEGMRVATAMELGCADARAPCKLPNAFLADPPLRPVISRGAEAGLRWQAGGVFELSLAAYRTALSDDIVFVASESINSGYFKNVPRTLRQGLEADLRWRKGAWELAAHYHHTRATFGSSMLLPSPANSEADAQGNIQVSPGQRLPGIPAHRLLLNLAFEVTEQWRVAATVQASGPQFARGDENNRDRYGRLPGYALLNFDARLRFAAGWDLTVQVDNVFNRRYQAFGVLGENFFRGPGFTFAASAAQPSQFRAPGAPRGIWLSLHYSWPGQN